MICPACNGEKGISLLCGPKGCTPGHIPCHLCNDSGKVSEEVIKRYSEGRKKRDDRLSRDLSLREEAKRLGISPIELSYIETGRIYVPPVAL